MKEASKFNSDNHDSKLSFIRIESVFYFHLGEIVLKHLDQMIFICFGPMICLDQIM